MRRSVTSLVSLVLTPVTLFLASDTARVNRAKLTIIGTLVASLFLFNAKLFLPGGAEQFIAYADAIIHGTTLGPSVSQRDAGYPLLFILSGYPLLHSVIPLLVVQAVFAVALPLLVFDSLRGLSPCLAFYTGLVSILTLGPYIFMKMIHHDQSYIFFSMLTLCTSLLLLQTKKLRYLYLFTLATVFASIVRPAGNALFPIFIVVSYLAAGGKIRHYFACVALFVVALGGYSWHRYRIFDAKDAGSTPSYTGEQLFYDPYVNLLDYRVKLSPKAVGPAFTFALEQLRTAVEPNPSDSAFVVKSYIGSDRSAQVFAQKNIFPFTAQQLIDRTLDSPNYEYYSLICAANDDKIMLHAAWEIARNNPALILRYTTRNILHFVFDPGYGHSRYSLDPFGPEQLIFFPSIGVLAPDAIASLRPLAAREMRFNNSFRQLSFLRNPFDRLEKLWLKHYRQYVAILSGFMCVAWVTVLAALARQKIAWWPGPTELGSEQPNSFTFPKGLIPSIVVASLLFGYNAVLTSLFVEPDFRYRQMVDLQALVIAGLGAVSIHHWLKVYIEFKLPYSFSLPVNSFVRLLDKFDLWRHLTATQLVLLATGSAIASFAGWALFMFEHTAI